MSGGSMDYFYIKVEEVANDLRQRKCPYRKALGKHLLDVSSALHDIEWVDSGDGAEGDGLPAIKKALGENAKGLALAELIEDAKVIVKDITELIAGVGKG